MKLTFGLFALLFVFNSFAETKIVYKSISECIKDLYDNTPHSHSSAKEYCLTSKAINIHYASLSACIKDLYDNTAHSHSSAKDHCLNL